MGCDIHLVVEKKNPDGNWEIIKKDYDVGRNYHLFSILANVRNCEKDDPEYIAPISEPRGLPADSPTIKFIRDSSTDFNDPDMWESRWDPDDTHSHSYHTLKQLKEYNWETHFCGFFYDLVISDLKKIALECSGDENVRIVFCFDS